MKNILLSTAMASLPTIAHAEEFPVKRCMNLGAALEAPFEGDWGYVIEQRHIARLAADGFDTIRLPVKFSAYWDGTRVDPDLLARVDEIIGWAEDAGLYIIVDLHHFWELNEDPARYGDDLVAIWAYLSDHYKGASDRVIFELYNEPDESFTTAMAIALFDRIIPDLRVDHPTAWVITGGDGWNDLDQMLTMPPVGPYEARTFHYYVPWQFTHQQAAYMVEPPPARDWGTTDEHARLKADIARAATADAPVFLGEFGVYDATDLDQKIGWVRAVRQAAESHEIGWCYWGFTQGGGEGFSAFDVTSDTWIPGMYEALIQ